MPLISFGPDAIRASQLNQALDNVYQVAFLFSDVIVNNRATPIQVPDLTCPMTGYAWYAFDALLMFSSTTTADILFEFAAPFNTFFGIARWYVGATAAAGVTTNQIDVGMDTDATTASFIMGGVGASTTITARLSGYIVPDATSGNLTTSFTQNPPEASNTTLKQGSWISLARVF